MSLKGFDHTFSSAGVLKVTQSQGRALAVTSASSIMQEHTCTCILGDLRSRCISRELNTNFPLIINLKTVV